MSAAAQTRIFGVRIPVDPKILFAGLAVLIAVLFWYNSRSDEEAPAPVSTVRPANIPAPAAVPLRTRSAASRRALPMSDRGALRLRPIDPTKGDIDPTLRLDLLARLGGVEPFAGGRSLFESGSEPVGGITPVPAHPPILPPRPRPVSMAPGASGMPTMAPVVAIPLKYYGYVKPVLKSPDAKLAPNQGFFLDGDNVLVGAEGDVLKQRYLVVELTPNSARLEDTQLRQSQTLPVVAAAMP